MPHDRGGGEGVLFHPWSRPERGLETRDATVQRLLREWDQWGCPCGRLERSVLQSVSTVESESGCTLSRRTCFGQYEIAKQGCAHHTIHSASCCSLLTFFYRKLSWIGNNRPFRDCPG